MDQHVQCVFTNKKLSICKHTVHALVFAQICVRDIPTTKKYMGGQECQIIFFSMGKGSQIEVVSFRFFCSMGRRSRVS